MTIKDLTEEIESTEALGDMASSLTEIGSIELRKLRAEVDRHRAFFQDLTYIFGLLRYFSRASHIHKVSGNGKTVTILLTSNFRHYTKTSNDAAAHFMNFTEKNQTDQIVIGKLGVEYLTVKKYNQKYQTLIFNNDIPTLPEMKKLVQLSKDYSQILVVFDEFKSVLTQRPAIKDITQRQNLHN